MTLHFFCFFSSACGSERSHVNIEDLVVYLSG